MCPACLTTAAWIAASVTSTGGLAAVVIQKFGLKKFSAKSAAELNSADNNPAPTPSKEDDHA